MTESYRGGRVPASPTPPKGRIVAQALLILTWGPHPKSSPREIFWVVAKAKEGSASHDTYVLRTTFRKQFRRRQTLCLDKRLLRINNPIKDRVENKFEFTVCGNTVTRSVFGESAKSARGAVRER